MAEVIGDNIIGKHTTFGPIADPWVSLAGDLQFGGVGITSREAESNGMNLVTGFSSGRTRASYYPGKKDLYRLSQNCSELYFWVINTKVYLLLKHTFLQKYTIKEILLLWFLCLEGMTKNSSFYFH